MTLTETLEAALEAAQIGENILADDTLTDEEKEELIQLLVLDGEPVKEG